MKKQAKAKVEALILALLDLVRKDEEIVEADGCYLCKHSGRKKSGYSLYPIELVEDRRVPICSMCLRVLGEMWDRRARDDGEISRPGWAYKRDLMVAHAPADLKAEWMAKRMLAQVARGTR